MPSPPCSTAPSALTSSQLPQIPPIKYASRTAHLIPASSRGRSTIRAVRKLLSLALLLILSFPLLSPLLALSNLPASRLPICCRNNGAHHCEGMPGDDTHVFASARSRCASYPQSVASARTGALSIHTSSQLLVSSAPPLSLRSFCAPPPLNPAATEGHPRGPPAPLL